MIGDDDCGEIDGIQIVQGKQEYWEKTYPNATLSTTNPRCLDPVVNPGSRCGKPATKRLSYGAVITRRFITVFTRVLH
jgi:hypothetical protein